MSRELVSSRSAAPGGHNLRSMDVPLRHRRLSMTGKSLDVRGSVAGGDVMRERRVA